MFSLAMNLILTSLFLVSQGAWGNESQGYGSDCYITVHDLGTHTKLANPSEHTKIFHHAKPANPLEHSKILKWEPLIDGYHDDQHPAQIMHDKAKFIQEVEGLYEKLKALNPMFVKPLSPPSPKPPVPFVNEMLKQMTNAKYLIDESGPLIDEPKIDEYLKSLSLFSKHKPTNKSLNTHKPIEIGPNEESKQILSRARAQMSSVEFEQFKDWYLSHFYFDRMMALEGKPKGAKNDSGSLKDGFSRYKKTREVVFKQPRASVLSLNYLAEIQTKLMDEQNTERGKKKVS